MKQILSIICLALLMTACEKESSSTDLESPAPQDGEWHLDSIIAFGPGSSFEIDDYIWTIDSAEGTLFVEENLNNTISVFIPGDWHQISFSVDSLFVDSMGYGYSVEQGDLYVSNRPELDGPIYRFIRPE